MSTLIFIDGSYFVFYRYFSLLSWYRNAKKDLPPLPSESEEFVNKFKAVFEKSIKEIPKRLGLAKENTVQIYIGKDCPREEIWRTKLYPDYKGGRKDIPDIGYFFNLVYDEDLFIKAGCKQILFLDQLEADDCIALALKTWSYTNAFIIASDKDYLQLYSDKIEIYDLHFKPLSGPSIYKNNPDLDLFCKILTGDPSDNIKPIFKKCGPVTATKLFWNKDLFASKLREDPGAKERFDFNNRLINFNEIPAELRQQFEETFKLYSP